MVNYTTQNAQKLTILISKTQKFSGEGAPPRRLWRLGTSRLRRSTSAPPQVLPPSYAYALIHNLVWGPLTFWATLHVRAVWGVYTTGTSSTFMLGVT